MPHDIILLIDFYLWDIIFMIRYRKYIKDDLFFMKK